MNDRRSAIRKRVGVVCVVIVAALPLLSLILSRVDYSRADYGKRPIFSLLTALMQDGGTKEWSGLGYRLTTMHSLAERDGVEGYTVGPILNYWVEVWPFRNKQHTRFEASDE